MNEKRKNEWWNINNILEKNAQWNMVFGKRSNGKSYGVREYVVEDAIKQIDKPEGVEKNRLFYLRRFSDDVTIFGVNKYFEDFIKIERNEKMNKIQKLSNNRFNSIKVAKNKIWVINIDDEGEETDRYHIGYYNSIGNAERIKSHGYSDVKNIVFEEFITSSKPYLAHEPELLENIVSTIARNREVKVFMIGNNDSRDCVYFNYFGLDHIRKQKPGTIDVYEKETGEYDELDNPLVVRFAVEYCGNNVKSSGMFFGKAKQKIDGGEWSARSHPKLKKEKIEQSEEIYRFVVDYHNFMYLCLLMVDIITGDYYYYISPKTTKIKPFTRVICDRPVINQWYSNNFNGINNGEKIAFDILRNGNIFYSDDLTGEEFERALKYFKIIT